MNVDLTIIGFATAFLAGLVSFLSPCVLPLVPGYISYVSGSSLESLRDEQAARTRALVPALCFVAGFSTVFIGLGASATALGDLLMSWRYELGIIAGVLIVLFGLHMLGLSPLRLMQRDLRFEVDRTGGRAWGAYLMGGAFAFGWTPCIGPILGAILTMSAQTADVGAGMALLAVYAAGLGLPFMLAALFTDVLLRRLRRLSSTGRRLQQLAGGLLVIMGMLMLTGRLELVAYWMLETFPVLTQLG